jgi:hypothetical protein
MANPTWLTEVLQVAAIVVQRGFLLVFARQVLHQRVVVMAPSSLVGLI